MSISSERQLLVFSLSVSFRGPQNISRKFWKKRNEKEGFNFTINLCFYQWIAMNVTCLLIQLCKLKISYKNIEWPWLEYSCTEIKLCFQFYNLIWECFNTSLWSFPCSNVRNFIKQTFNLIIEFGFTPQKTNLCQIEIIILTRCQLSSPS